LIGKNSSIFRNTDCPEGILLHGDEQLQLLRRFAALKEDLPFYEAPGARRFTIENDSFSYDDAPVLAYMLRIIRPKRIIEIGSGNSTSCILDIDDRYCGRSIDLTIIDIDTANPRMNLFTDDHNRIHRIEKPVQEVDKEIFRTLQAGDLLFIDSSHVMKTGSDVCVELFEILPVLRSGVFVHFHDILYPFEYPLNFIKNRIFWNEAYAVRAFLMYNNAFTIRFWLSYLLRCHLQEVQSDLRCLPLDKWKERFGHGDLFGAGGSLYIQKR
jgi:hypothetical protein